MNYAQIVWLASYPKSGNTWIRCFLDAYYLGAVDLNEIVCSVADDISTRYAVGDGSDIRTMPIDIQQLARPMAMLRLVRAFGEDNSTGVPLFVKTHSANMVANGIELLPRSLTRSVIHIVRDPRDVFLSFRRHMGVDSKKALEYFFDKYRVLTDEREGAAKVHDLISSWYDHTRSFVSCGTHNIMTFRYEDMKAQPAKAFAMILKHAGVEPDMRRVEMALDAVKLSKLKAQEEKEGFKEASPHTRFFGQGCGWENELTDLEERRIRERCGSMMKRFGYLRKGVKAA